MDTTTDHFTLLALRVRGKYHRIILLMSKADMNSERERVKAPMI